MILLLVITHLILIGKVFTMATDITALTREVEENTTVVESAIALLDTLAAEIRANVTDQAALEELADKLDANSNRLADAVAANTAAEEETPVE